MNIFQSNAWQDWEPRYRRLLLAMWISLLLAGFFLLAAAEATIVSYTLEKLTTHGPEGLVLKQIALASREEYTLFMGFMTAASAALCLTAGVMSRLTLPHWRTWVLALVLSGLPLLVGSILALFWAQKAPELFAWGTRQIILLGCVQSVSSLAGVIAGRFLAPLLMRVLVPPRWRPPPHSRQTPPAPSRPTYWREHIGP